VNVDRPLRVVTPTLDGDVLSVLARAEVEFSGREIHRALGHASHTGVRRCLRRLVEQGIVLERQAGNALLYRLNRDHLAAPLIEGLATLRLQLFERLRSTIADWRIQPAAAAVFGSVARGDSDERSDLDLFLLRPAAVTEDEETWRDQTARLEDAASRWTGNDTRVLEYSESELPTIRRTERVLQDVVADGIVLAGSLNLLGERAKTQ
jgi:predicted nucleotidyltransferase